MAMDAVNGLLNLALDARQRDVEGSLLLPLIMHSALQGDNHVRHQFYGVNNLLDGLEAACDVDQRNLLVALSCARADSERSTHGGWKTLASGYHVVTSTGGESLRLVGTGC
jgi:hypothetical protein